MSLAPDPQVPERFSPVFEVKTAPEVPGKLGPDHFQEGLGTDPSVPNDFMTGVMSGYTTPPGRPNHNAQVWIKPAAETTRERMHAGSAAWTEAPEYLDAFAAATGDEAEQKFIVTRDPGGLRRRPNPARVSD
jgi:hypothetical protein